MAGPLRGLGESIGVALDALRANKLRSLPTMLGIIIGVGTVITMVALGSGAQRAVQDRIQALGPTLLRVLSGQDLRGGVAISGAASLTYADDTALANHARYVADVVPTYQHRTQWWVMTAKQEATRLRRLAVLIESSAKGARLG